MDEDTTNYISNTGLSNLIDRKDDLSKYNTLFFDNDPKNFKGFDDNNLNILIDDSIPNEHIIDMQQKMPLQFVNTPFPTKLKENSEHNNPYINALLYYKETETPMPVEGFNKRHIDIVNHWINAHKTDKPLYLIFDWDRTLSVCEGFRMLSDEQNDFFYGENYNDNQIYNDMLIYLMGGEERYLMLQHFLNAMCKKPNIRILVITANPSADKKHMNYDKFFNMAKLLIPCLEKEHFLCSSSSSKFIEFNEYKKKSQGPSKSKKSSPKSKKPYISKSKKSRKRGGRKNRAIKSRRYK